MLVRPDSSDHNNVTACMTEDEYHVSDLDLGEGVALDIGAHVGGVAIGLALDNRQARVIAVEALSENVAILQENVDINGVADRVTVVHGAATKAGRKTVKIEWGFGADENGQHHRFIGNAVGWNTEGAQHETVPAVTLASLVEMAGGEVAFMKIDCETCEYQLLDSPAVAHVKEIRGEYHAGFEGIVSLLGDTHHVQQLSGLETLGSFKAVRK